MRRKNKQKSMSNLKIHINSTSRCRSEANAKERIRTQSANLAFDMLRNLIPTEPLDRKLSKIEILRLASSYIAHLGSILLSGKCERGDNQEMRQDQRLQICTFCLTLNKSISK